MDLHVDSHMGFHKEKMIPIPNGHRKSEIPMPMPNLVIMARATFLQEWASSQLASGLPKIVTYNNLYLVSQTGLPWEWEYP